MASPTSATQEIVVYWRPGCGFCKHLRSQLDKNSIPHRLVNIWDNPSAAGIVRSIANGNETVPTVVVGTVGLVNPSLSDVLVTAMAEVPAAVPEGYEPPKPGRAGRFMARILGG